MLKALLRTFTEILDSKKAAYSFAAVFGACVLHLHFGVSIQDAMLLVSPLGLATVAQAHVDAKSEAADATSSTRTPPTAPAIVPPTPAPTPSGSSTTSSTSSTTVSGSIETTAPPANSVQS